MSAAKSAAKGHIEARHYDTIVAPLITEKATIRDRDHNQVRFPRPPRGDQAADQVGGREACSTSRSTAVNTLIRKGKAQDVQAVRPGRQQDPISRRRLSRWPTAIAST